MTFEKFAEFIDRYKFNRDKFDKWAASTEDYFEDCMMGFIPDDDLPLDILREIFKDDDDWIRYWVYDLEFGSRWVKGMITVDGVEISLRTVRDLYNFLVLNMHIKNNSEEEE